ncbi:MAG: dihydrolipoyl dehydrogenase [Armatimonadota bacterium]|nr:dihydrolipoyl dehydrogenase [Armatimonadota bacterium]MDR7437550.1 dihydrolipoyl dehydrogenase [Armatimonadota bacterium]MDR7471681.1 dihydrolipoyl dehydrogenase [Armatimonadota bacterium]MDR7507726.1 dihydrolipoyl dehydrogenase [Armatimonadota bacterium]MDR7516832.1 dihydrolipoyl dehydrogenase [Armatimonadota bacterium]
MAEPYDLVIIGGGPGGYVGAIRAAQLGLRTALVERDKLGGTCLHVGCIPTKAMLHTAELLDHLRDPRDLGLTVDGVGVDLAAVHRRKARVVDQLHKGVQYLMRKHRIDVFAGEGRFLSATRVGVALSDGSETELSARHVLIATGSAPRSIPGVTIDHGRIIDSTDALHLQEVPRSIAILGAGPVGVEFASLFRALGSQVTIIELLPTLVPLEDEEIGQALERSFVRRGITVLTRATARAATAEGGRVRLEVVRGEETSTLDADYLLVAVGRGPVTDGLAAAEAGVELEKGAVRVDEQFRTTAGTVFAIGDVLTGLRPYRLAHVASDEAIAAVETIAGQRERGVNYDAVPRPTYSIPQVASMGLTERQARERGLDVRVGRFSFQASSKATIEGAREGFVKVVADARVGEILGIHMMGPAVTELLAAGVVARSLEATVTELAEAVYSHPTLGEALKEAALDALGRVLHA